MAIAVLPAQARATEPDLNVKAVLKDTGQLYLGLFRRAVGLSLIVFGVLDLLQFGLIRISAIPPLLTVLVALMLTFAGTSLVQGALAETVRDVHVGAPPLGILESYRRAWARLLPLLSVAGSVALRVGLGFLLFVIPGLVLMVRYSVAVPVLVYEGVSPREALRRSHELVRGHGRAVFTILANAGLRVGIVNILINLVGGRVGGPAAWVFPTLGAALTTPYFAHALSVLYYRLTEPDRPVIPAPREQWHSIWHEGS